MNQIIPLAVARDELRRIDAVLDSPQLLIGGLAVQQYYQNRDSADIDLVCTRNTAKKLIDELYDSADFDIVDSSDDVYRPNWTITETGEGKRVVYLGFKITERAAYKYVDYDRILKQARPYRHGTELNHIKVPIVEDLALLKLLSMISRLSSNPVKGDQDRKDFINLINHKEFKARVFLDPIKNECRDYLIKEIAQLQEGRDEPLFANSTPARLFAILFPSKPVAVASPDHPATVPAHVEEVSEKIGSRTEKSEADLKQLPVEKININEVRQTKGAPNPQVWVSGDARPAKAGVIVWLLRENLAEHAGQFHPAVRSATTNDQGHWEQSVNLWMPGPFRIHAVVTTEEYDNFYRLYRRAYEAAVEDRQERVPHPYNIPGWPYFDALPKASVTASLHVDIHLNLPLRQRRIKGDNALYQKRIKGDNDG